MSGVELAALYGIYPCLLGLCGSELGRKIISDYLFKKELAEEKVKEVLKQFKGAFPYYSLIAKCNNIKDPFDERVVRAYWIGNEFLDNVDINSLKELIEKEFLLSDKNIPVNSRPHHSFHVLVIGSVTGTIDLKGELLDICRVSWGKVIKKDKDILIEYQPLDNNSLGKLTKKTISWDKDLIPNVEIGDNVSCHWNNLIQMISKEDVNNLEKYTKITLDSLNA